MRQVQGAVSGFFPRPSWQMGVAGALAFAAAYLLLGYFQFYHWLITNGLLFAMLWWAGRSWWPWLFAGTILSRLASGALIWSLAWHEPGRVLWFWDDWTQVVLGNLVEPFLVVTGVILLHRWGVRPGDAINARAISRLHVAAAVSSLAVTCKDVLYVLNDGFVADITRGVVHDAVPFALAGPWGVVFRFAVEHFMGGFVGILMVMPIFMWWTARTTFVDSRQVVWRVLRFALPTSLAFALMDVLVQDQHLVGTLRLLMLAVVAIAAVVAGWRGAVVASLTVSLAAAVADHFGIVGGDPVQLQVFIAISGAMGMMLGATIDELHRQRQLLESARAKATELARNLSTAAMGNLRTEERERHRIAGELHDELGQNLTAMQTWLRLSDQDFRNAGQSALLDRLYELTRTMRYGVGSVLERLRPAALEELGLYGAIDRGGLRRMAEDAGLTFEVQLSGDARLLALLDDAYRIAAYRLVQESITNIVRHAQATACHVRLRVERRDGSVWLLIDVRDDGVGGLRQAAGRGLGTMRDRVIALGGRLHVRETARGVRVHALLRQHIVPRQRIDD